MNTTSARLPVYTIRGIRAGEDENALALYAPVAEALLAIDPDMSMYVQGDRVGFALEARHPGRDSFNVRIWAPPYDAAGEDLWIIHYGDLSCEDGGFEYFDNGTDACVIAEAVANLFR